jgi:hypothetical protein
MATLRVRRNDLKEPHQGTVILPWRSPHAHILRGRSNRGVQITIVEHYAYAALQRAIFEELEDGTVSAYIPECKGVLAFGADLHECAVDLYARLEDWVRVSLIHGDCLPVIGDVDINEEANQILATYHSSLESESAQGEFFEDEDQLEAAFEKRSHAT